ncbi:MAG: hypothetical protein DRR16_00120 [Candidatus Parabeggiatoa sp. nov. 3]|nr:MAG: hypothetical protein DRR00_05880 [Gammaproteobacteria bacterium]RKZ69622.1 MAG: hypothetical protein DRQ99_00540 [Gammaproteobacteria bacterium]RKZ90277.1 MAG: hypothetical protein DRR16_00120 [Gammaproteobacteria bacterium]
MRYFKYLSFIFLLGLFIANPAFAQDDGSTGTDGTSATESGTGATPETGPETGATPETGTETGATPETGPETGSTPETNAETGNTPNEAVGETEGTPAGTETTPTSGETETTPPSEEIPDETGGEPDGTTDPELTGGGDETPITFTSTITPMTGVMPLTVTMTAITTAKDVEGITYHWQASSGKDTYQSGAFATMTFESPGEYIITFVAWQNEKILDSATHTVTVLANLLPIARLKAGLPCENNEKHCETPLTVELSAADSTDPNGEIVGYRFTSSIEGQIFPDEKTGPGLLLCPNEAYSFCPTGEVTYKENWTKTATPIPAVELKDTGIHDITVIVIDDKGGISKEPASVSIVVEKSTKPSAVFDFSLKGEYAPMPIQLDASKSKDYFAFKEQPNGKPRIVQYQWTVFSNGKSITHESLAKTFEHTLENPGYYTLTLKVTDNDGQSNTARQNVYVKGAKQPIAVADVNPSSGKIGDDGLEVTLNAEGSYDPDGFDIAQYIWRISDGQTVKGATGKVTLRKTGLVTIELEVTDQDNHTAKAFQTVMVQENTENNQYPKAVGTFSKLSGRAPLTVEGNATSSYDPDGDTITHHWSSTAGHDVTGDVRPVSCKVH